MSATDKLIRGFEEGTAPPVVRGAAARGALPFPPAVLLDLQVILLDDGDDAIREAAAASLAALGTNDVLAMLDEPELSDRAMAWLAAETARWPDAGEALARRSEIPEAAAAALASSGAPAVLEALSRNQRLLAIDPALGRSLAENPALPGSAKNRLLDILDEIEKAAERRTPGKGEPSPDALAPASDPFLAALGVDAELEEILPTLGLDLGQLMEKSELLSDEEAGAVYVRLSRMKVGEKLRTAIFGTKEERTVLVRDTNRVVAAAVVKNPKFTEQEADAVSKSRNVNEEVLRLIGTHRDFAKAYHIQRNLVSNPRTPLEIALRFVTRLQDRDLKLLSKSRSVPESVRRQAKKVFETREARRRVRVGKGRH